MTVPMPSLPSLLPPKGGLEWLDVSRVGAKDSVHVAGKLPGLKLAEPVVSGKLGRLLELVRTDIPLDEVEKSDLGTFPKNRTLIVRERNHYTASKLHPAEVFHVVARVCIRDSRHVTDVGTNRCTECDGRVAYKVLYTANTPVDDTVKRRSLWLYAKGPNQGKTYCIDHLYGRGYVGKMVVTPRGGGDVYQVQDNKPIIWLDEPTDQLDCSKLFAAIDKRVVEEADQFRGPMPLSKGIVLIVTANYLPKFPFGRGSRDPRSVSGRVRGGRGRSPPTGAKTTFPPSSVATRPPEPSRRAHHATSQRVGAR